LAASAQAVRHVWRSDCQQISAHPSERNASWSPPPPVGPPVVVPPSPVAPTVIVSTALMYRGIPYRNGGSDPSGFDCSGFVQWVFAQNGIQLPREVHDQYDAGQKIDLRDVQPGDLLFFETVSRGASHVGVAVGGDQFVHAPSSKGVVRIERFTAGYWAMRFVGARRIATEDTKTN
jgi:cell wall-associated NlpC family hydrolase